jgi:predicted esterase
MMKTTTMLAVVLAHLAVLFAARGDDALWPARFSAGDEYHGRIVAIEAQHGLRASHSVWGITRPSEHDRAAARSLVEHLDDPPQLIFEGPGAFVYVPATEPRPRARGRAAPLRHDLLFKFVSGRDIASADAPAVSITRTWFAWYDASVPDDAPPRGTILLMPGMLGTPEPIIELFITRLRENGYGILRMMCQPSRFTERIIFEVDLEEPEPAARAMADEVAQRLAECAYAVQAAFQHIAAERPGYAGLPRIALGMSGGAMILPTVVAREPDRYAAAILIAGGANMMAILDQSNYKEMIGAADIRWNPDPTPEQRRDFDALYLSLALLDPYHTAAHLRGTPMLMIHGSHDLAVPAALGDLLWEQLGKPDRWTEEAGHELLFMRLPQRVDSIIEWLDAAIAETARR